MLLIDGWFDLHKTDKARETTVHTFKSDVWEVPLCWEMGIADFLKMLFPNLDYAENSKYRDKDVYRASFYWSNADKEFISLYDYIADEKNAIYIYRELKKYVQMAHRLSCLLQIKERLIYLLEHTEKHDTMLRRIMVGQLEKLSDGEYEKWINALYYYLYFAVTDKIHRDVGYRKYENLEKDLEEYNQFVIMSYGCSGLPGMSQIYAMANRNNPNIIALYEMGEMEYYGRGPSGSVHYENAYQYYSKTLELNDAHPLALWSIAYIKFNYKKKGSELEHAYIAELEDEYPIENNYKMRRWCEDIINKVSQSYCYGCTAAANLIGKIIDAKEEDFPHVYKGIYKYEDAKKYYKESADGKYVYGCNNYAEMCLKEMKLSTEQSEKERYFNEALKYLSISAEKGEFWACNRLGLYYLKGVQTEKQTLLQANSEKAYYYFKNGLKMSGIKKYYWPLINLCEHFYFNEESKYFKSVTWDRIFRKLLRAQENLEGKDAEQYQKIAELICRAEYLREEEKQAINKTNKSYLK